MQTHTTKSGIEIILPSTIQEISFKQYCKAMELQSKKFKKEIEDDFYYPYRFMEYLLDLEDGTLDLSIEEFNDIQLKMEFILDYLNTPLPEDTNIHYTITINETKYQYRTINGLNDMTVSEKASLDLIQTKLTDVSELYPLMCAILIRPAKEITNKETGDISYRQSGFVGDMVSLQSRADLFKEELLFEDGHRAITFFLNGLKELMTIMESSLVQEEK